MKTIFFPLVLLFILLSLVPGYAQQQSEGAHAKAPLSLQPFIGINHGLNSSREHHELITYRSWTEGGEPSTSEHYVKDEHSFVPGLEAGLRTQLQLCGNWGIQAETGIQQLSYRRMLDQEYTSNGYTNRYDRSSSLRLLYFYQSLEAAYQIKDKFQISGGPYAATLLSSYQNWPLFVPEGDLTTDQEKVKKAGHGLRDTQLGLQAKLSYQIFRGLSATSTVRQSLQSVYSEEAQPAGAIKPTSFSLTLGYKFQVK